jgi:hypothetical protein
MAVNRLLYRRVVVGRSISRADAAFRHSDWNGIRESQDAEPRANAVVHKTAILLFALIRRLVALDVVLYTRVPIFASQKPKSNVDDISRGSTASVTVTFQERPI